MIYSPKEQPPAKQSTVTPPTISLETGMKSLNLMLLQGPEMYDAIKLFIVKNKLPCELSIDEQGNGSIKQLLCDGDLFLNRFITVDSKTIEMKQDARKIAKTQHEVLIIGETGTGKEIIAKSMIADRKGPIKSVNCAGFPEQLFESELFGHVKGSFTGADNTKQGLMQAAENGVLFLDEIGEMPLHLQAKLLRAIQDKRVRKVGSNEEIEINCKFVCATNRDLTEMVKAGLFRRDLYARISTLELFIEPLRERQCDIEPITLSLNGGKPFWEKYSNELKSGQLDISNNVRSIQQHVTRYSVLGRVILSYK